MLNSILNEHLISLGPSQRQEFKNKMSRAADFYFIIVRFPAVSEQLSQHFTHQPRDVYSRSPTDTQTFRKSIAKISVATGDNSLTEDHFHQKQAAAL